jgi:hypothetical protein
MPHFDRLAPCQGSAPIPFSSSDMRETCARLIMGGAVCRCRGVGEHEFAKWNAVNHKHEELRVLRQNDHLGRERLPLLRA